MELESHNQDILQIPQLFLQQMYIHISIRAILSFEWRVSI